MQIDLSKQVLQDISDGLAPHLAKGESISNLIEYRDTFGKSSFLAIIPAGIFTIKSNRIDKPLKVIDSLSLISAQMKSKMLEIGYLEGTTKRKLVLNVSNQEMDEVLNDLNAKIVIAQDEREKRQLEKLESDQLERERTGNFIGKLKAESGLDTHVRGSKTYNDRKLLDLLRNGGKSIDVYEKLIIQDGVEYSLDKFTSAEVSAEGQIQVTHRPTLTRMALLAPLPGTALIGGMALQKKNTYDSREVHVIIANPKWTCVVRVSFRDLQSAKEISNRLNKICESLAEVRMEPVAAIEADDKIEKLMKLQKLTDSGILSKKELAQLKKEIMES